MITTLVALALMPAADLDCAVMGSPVKETTKVALDYAGVRYPFCCGGCDSSFAGNPAKFSVAAKGKTIGFFLFDAVSGARLNFSDEVKEFGPIDFKGTRYYFASQANADAFKADSKKYATVPTKEVLRCPKSKEDIENPADAAGYVDVAGVRYYICCEHCLPDVHSKPNEFIGNVKDVIKPLTVFKVKP